ncbi:hypothetical protein [Frigoribacterium sp. VKM Ac-2836]|uniref:hypothetical protein n=1 Tax=Frigoribacterium sp. VKM Ac-2836 TaxID=2739014 RepID=UPI0015669C67|nr:hypothetical protein [Frigoribacterium sp. VKM Ac-2836]NRD26190.1 hypothetical protein [Frigoribacterium sp. VKM Ac-2836]
MEQKWHSWTMTPNGDVSPAKAQLRRALIGITVGVVLVVAFLVVSAVTDRLCLIGVGVGVVFVALNAGRAIWVMKQREGKR